MIVVAAKTVLSDCSSRLAATIISSGAVSPGAFAWTDVWTTDTLKQRPTKKDEFVTSFIIKTSMKITFHEGEARSRG
jgi:hypothetical protein